MKKLMIGSLIVLPVFLVAGLIESKNKRKNNKIDEPKRISKMTHKKTDSGLQYEVIKEGTGASPKKGQQVTVHYTGWLNEQGEPGKKFDSSVDRGQPFTFTLGVCQVIEGWDEGVMPMKVGEKRRLFIPSELAYGTRGAGQVIRPNADLIFDVELLKVG
ncbi:MAG: FKBP-type peptidyl-prolyl cis-trans isomerase [Candidatus Babeliales bacterium]